MIKGRRRAYRRIHRAKGFPLCLPSQADLEAVYLGKVAPSSAGVVYDESGNGNDAQLVNSYALQGDGVVYAETSDVIIHNGTSFEGVLIWRNDGNTGSIYGQWDNVSGNRSWLIYASSAINIRLFYSSDSVNQATLNIPQIAGWNTLYYNFNNGTLTYIINGVSLSATLSFTTINIPNKPFNILSQGSGQFPYNGAVAYLCHGNVEFNPCNGGLIEAIPNTGTAGGDATLFDATYPTLWTTQDIFHYNFLNGFDLYENGTAGEEIRVPIGHAFSQSGYTLTSSNPAGKWHNGAETEIDLDDTLKAVIDLDITDPLSYDDFQTFYGDSAMSNTEENKKKKLVFYDRDLTDAEKITIQKCIDAKTGVDVLLEEDGITPLTEESGVYLIEG